MPVGDINRTIVYCQMNEQAGLNVWYQRLGSLVGPELSQQQRADNMQAALSISFPSLIASQAQFRTIGLRHVFPLPMGSEVLGTGPVIGGAGAGGAMPRQAAGIITTRTGLAGRANRGRKYVPFPSEDQNDTDATPNGIYVGLLDTYAGFFIPSFTLTIGATTEVWNAIIFRTANPLVSPNLTSWQSRERWATQRRRGSYGVPNIPPA